MSEGNRNPKYRHVFPERPVISDKGIYKLQELWLQKFHSGERFPRGEAERWFTCVMEFLSVRGDEVVTNQLREQEERVINLGRSQEYLAALAESMASSPQHNDYDKTVLVLTASVEERTAALKKVLGV